MVKVSSSFVNFFTFLAAPGTSQRRRCALRFAPARSVSSHSHLYLLAVSFNSSPLRSVHRPIPAPGPPPPPPRIHGDGARPRALAALANAPCRLVLRYSPEGSGRECAVGAPGAGVRSDLFLGTRQTIRQGWTRGYASASGLEHLSINSQEKVDPFSLVADELQVVANRLRSMVTAEVPVLALAAEYFFKMGVEGKRFRPTVLLLMSTALMTTPALGLQVLIFDDLRLRQQRIAEIAEMIHVASLLHDDVLDHADTRRGISSLNNVMGNKLAVLAGDFLLARASVALASLRNTEVVELFSKVLDHLVTGEVMQLSSEPEEMSNMDYYMKKTFYKTASLMANSCKSIAVLGGQPEEVALHAFDYGRHLGLAYQLVDDALDYTGTTKTLGKPALSDLGQGIVTAPVLFALKEFPELSKLIQRKFKTATDRNQAVEMVRESRGIAQTHELAAEHAQKAVDAIDSLPQNPSLQVQQCRRALKDIAHQVITRSK